MKAIGIDIGTTTICGTLVDLDNAQMLQSTTLPNSYAMNHTFFRLQNPEEIVKKAMGIYNALRTDDSVCVGITGQMHGVLYLDADGNAVSPLHTWQDESGNQPFQDAKTYAEYLSQITGYPCASGYGLTTHFYHMHQNSIPSRAVQICTIHDYLAMKLTNRTTPLMHVSDAASFGIFNIKQNNWDLNAIQNAKISCDILPEITKNSMILGTTPEGIPVSVPIGDNQASVIAGLDDENAVLINIGTGSQISCILQQYECTQKAEIRPYIDGKYLLVGCALCGGNSYSILKQFFTRFADYAGITLDDPYVLLNRMAEVAYNDTQNQHAPLSVCTLFKGTRNNPALRGSILDINDQNFTPENVALGFLKGECDELYDLYNQVVSDKQKVTKLIGTGNGIRKNPLLRTLIAQQFGQELWIPQTQEEAAYGCALFACHALGKKPLQFLQNQIHFTSKE